MLRRRSLRQVHVGLQYAAALFPLCRVCLYMLQVEEFGREMYKLFKMFTSKAKQIAREKEKESGGALTTNIRKDKKVEEPEFAPLKLSSQIQESIRVFKVNAEFCVDAFRMY